MVKAYARAKDGRVALVLGISGGNVKRLKQGQPIYFDLAQLHLADTERVGHVSIFYGATDDALRRAISELIGPDTEVIDIPKGPEKPQ